MHIGRGRLQVRSVFMELGGYIRHFGRWMVSIKFSVVCVIQIFLCRLYVKIYVQELHFELYVQLRFLRVMSGLRFMCKE